MRARTIVGKRIAKVNQVRIETPIGQRWALSSIELHDGTVLTFPVMELGHDYAIEASTYKAK